MPRRRISNTFSSRSRSARVKPLLALPAAGSGAGLQAGIDHGHRGAQQHAQDISKVPLPPQIQQVRVHRVLQPFQDGPGIQHPQKACFLHPLVAVEDAGHSPHLPQVLGAALGGQVVVQVQQGLEDVPLPAQQQLLNDHDHLVHIAPQQIPEQFLLVLEVHIEAAPGDTGLLDDLVDGGLVEGPAGEFPGGGLQQLFLFFRRQVHKRAARHGAPLLSNNTI